jgi:HEAT repeat protein
MEKIRAMDASSIFRAWIAAGGLERDEMKEDMIGNLLGNALRAEPPDPKTLRSIREFIADESNPLNTRAQLVQVLGQAGAKETQDILIETATSSASDELRQIATQAVAYGAGFRGDGKFHEELSPALEDVWNRSKNWSLLLSAAYAMAEVGAPGGVEKLVAAAVDTSPGNAHRAKLAKLALGQVRNPLAIPGLAAHLGSQMGASRESLIAGDTLASIGTAASVKVLIDWLQKADDGAAALVHAFVIKTSNRAIENQWKAALKPAVPFHSEKVREAIRAGVVAYHIKHI